MESRQKIKSRAQQILKRLERNYPDVKTALHYSTPFQLLVATILSAQCTDARVNIVTPYLFAEYPTIADLANANQRDVERIIRSTGFYRMKAKNIIAASKKIMDEFGGMVPSEMDALLKLPGVGRKTANCILGAAFGKNQGIVVDTHVLRLSNRLGLTSNTDPKKVELDLMDCIPETKWYDFSNYLIIHGRTTCHARKPLCDKCFLNDLCPKRNYSKKKGTV